MRDKKIISTLCATLIALTVVSGELPRLMTGSAFISAEGSPVIGESGTGDFDSANDTDGEQPEEELEIAAYSAEDVYTSGDYEYTVTDGKATITGYNGNAEILEIPGVIDGYPVTLIGYMAFWACKSLTNITIPNSVTVIGNWAFFSCENLANITLPDGLTSISEHAFSSCKSFTSIAIPDSVTWIGDNAFENCDSLTSITIPNSLTWIRYEVFCDCDNLTNVTIPDSVTSIEYNAFENCENLTEIIIDSENPSFKSISGVLYSKDGKKLLRYPEGKTEKEFAIPNSVTEIGAWAFSGCINLTNITTPNSVTEIGAWAFSDCINLTNITLKNGMTEISPWAFNRCTSLTNITIPNGIIQIDEATFINCTSLASITIPDSVIAIDKRAFEKCTSLTSVTIPDSVTEIGSWVFKGCENLTIYGYAGSYAETYANENGIPFVDINNQDLVGENTVIEDGRIPDLMNQSMFFYKNPITYQDVTNDYFTVEVDFVNKNDYLGVQNYYLENDSIAEIVSMEDVDKYGYTTTILTLKKKNDGKTNLVYALNNRIVDKCEIDLTVPAIIVSATKASSDHLLATKAVFNNYGFINDVVGSEHSVSCILSDTSVYKASDIEWTVSDESIIKRNEFSIISENSGLTFEYVACKEGFAVITASLPNGSFINFPMHIRGKKCNIELLHSGAVFSTYDELPYQPANLKLELSNDISSLTNDSEIMNYCTAQIQDVEITIPEGFSFDSAKEVREYKSDHFGSKSLIAWGEKFDLNIPLYTTIKSTEEEKLKRNRNFEAIVTIEYKKYIVTGEISLRRFDTAVMPDKDETYNELPSSSQAKNKVANTFERYYRGYLTGKGSSQSTLRTGFHELKNYISGAWFNKIVADTEMFCTFEMMGISSEGDYNLDKIFGYDGLKASSMLNLGKKTLLKFDNVSVNPKFYKTSKTITVYVEISNTGSSIGGASASMCTANAYISIESAGMHCGMGSVTYSNISSLNDELKSIYKNTTHANGSADDFEYWIKMGISEYLGVTNINMGSAGDIAKLIDKLYKSVSTQSLSSFTLNSVSDINNLFETTYKISSGKKKLISIFCPVDVEVFDSNNNLIGEIRDNIVLLTTDKAIMTVEGDIKKCSVDLTDEYIIRLTGTDNGTMDYVVDEIVDGKIIRTVKNNDLLLTATKTYYGNIDEIIYQNAESYALIDNDGISYNVSEDHYLSESKDFSNVVITIPENVSVYRDNKRIINCEIVQTGNQLTISPVELPGYQVDFLKVNGQPIPQNGIYTVKNEDIVITVGYSSTDHTHTFPDEWKSDSNSHWHECSCGEKSGLAAHMAGEWIVNSAAGYRHRDCTVCGAVLETVSLSGGSPSGSRPVTNPSAPTGTVNTENTDKGNDPADPKDEEPEEPEPDEADEEGGVDADTDENAGEDDEDNEDDEEDGEDNDPEDDGYDDTFSKDDTDGNDAEESAPTVTPEEIARDENPGTGVPANVAMIFGFLISGAAFAAFSKRRK